MNGVKEITLQSREVAIQFYKSLGYKIEKKTHLLFGNIQHFLKLIQQNQGLKKVTGQSQTYKFFFRFSAIYLTFHLLLKLLKALIC